MGVSYIQANRIPAKGNGVITVDKMEWIEIFNEEALTADGFDDAIIGIGERCGQPSLVAYDRDKCIQVLMDRDGMDYEEAVEFFDFNVAGAWMGENTPIFITRWEEQNEQVEN